MKIKDRGVGSIEPVVKKLDQRIMKAAWIVVCEGIECIIRLNPECCHETRQIGFANHRLIGMPGDIGVVVLGGVIGRPYWMGSDDGIG